MGDQTQAYDIFQAPISSGYPLPLTQRSPLLIPGQTNVALSLHFFETLYKDF